jgi:hypothetical protein
MSERHQIVELTDTVSLGFLATDLVLAMGRLLRKENLSTDDVSTLRSGRELLQRLGRAEPTLTPIAGPRLLTSDAVDLEVFRAARAQVPDEPVKTFVARMAEVLERSVSGALGPSDIDAARQARSLFMHLGEMTLSRADDLLTTPHRERPAWPQLMATPTS